MNGENVVPPQNAADVCMNEPEFLWLCMNRSSAVTLQTSNRLINLSKLLLKVLWMHIRQVLPENLSIHAGLLQSNRFHRIKFRVNLGLHESHPTSLSDNHITEGTASNECHIRRFADFFPFCCVLRHCYAHLVSLLVQKLWKRF